MPWLHAGAPSLWPQLFGAWLLRGCPHEAVAFPVTEPVDWVNVLSGAAGGERIGQHHSGGSTLPLAALPWGFNHWAPQSNSDKTSWWFDADSDTFRGIRCTHQPSPWIGDYGWFLLRPFQGSPKDEWVGFTSYRAAGALQPHSIDITAGPYGVRTELVPTQHGAALRVTFPDVVPADKRRVCVLVPRGLARDEDEARAAEASDRPTGSCSAQFGEISLVSRKFAQGVPLGSDFALYAWLEAEGLNAEEREETDWCFERDVRYVKKDGALTMRGHPKKKAGSAQKCQERCFLALGCEKFSYLDDGSCYLLNEPMVLQRAEGAVSGPADCDGQVQPVGSRECCFLAGERTQVEVRIGTSLISKNKGLRRVHAGGARAAVRGPGGRGEGHLELSAGAGGGR
ncbi:unnamed protein product [Prorocentrum cordatum]|uniref:Apple domain-containing protein n=1 Tax=Prorocentrum cordatum TaxID=2364126 RepID=A0ABN9P9S3_9DINO|nr:unnamed protein product [Polarella glacialis]